MAIEELQSARETPNRQQEQPTIRVLESRRPGILNALGELWRYRRFILYFGRRFLTKRYARTWLGLLWLPLRPILNVSTKLLVFGGIVGLTAGNTPYPVFFLLLSAAWVLFSESALWSARSLDMNRGLLREVHIPRLVVIVSAIVPSTIDFLISLGLGVLALGYYYARVQTLYLELTWWSPLSIGAALILLALLGIGVGLVTASAGARARDIRFGLTYGLGFAYFLTPVIYPFEAIPDAYKPLAQLNPVTGALEIFKLGLFPNEEVSPKAILVTIAAVFALWLPGLWLFQRREVRDW
ncbi:MAG: ABC transporter permease [Gaiellaceae bacterium MAG52_C11]|nr:ABC transporter permease [Candidatus Gaiellasilicea maunaloa]